LELAGVMASDAAAEDQGEFVGLTNGAIGIQEPLLESIDGGATTEDQIVAKLHLREKRSVLNPGVLSLLGSEEGREVGQPFLGTANHIGGGEGISKFLQGFRIGALQEGVSTLSKPNATLLHTQGQPIMLIETDPSGKGKVGAKPYEDLSPMGVLDIEVVLLYPTPLQLQMPTVVFPDGGQDGGGLACFDDGYNLIGLGTSEVALHKVIAPAWGIFLNGYAPFLGAVLGPIVILRGDVAQQLPTDGIALAIEVEKADDTLFLLKGLNRGMEQDTIEATIVETDVILMVFEKGVHGVLHWGQILWSIPQRTPLCFMPAPRVAARTFQDLVVWRKAHELVLAVYSFTASFPKEETYGLKLQMRRAAVSIPANIAEGFRRRGKADKARNMNMAEGSLEESRYYLILAQDLGYGDTSRLTTSLEEVSRLLNAYASAILASDS
jgi:four helix bundle protein